MDSFESKLIEAQPFISLFLRTEKSNYPSTPKQLVTEWVLPTEIITKVKQQYKNIDIRHIVFSVLLIYFHRICNQTRLNLGVSNSQLNQDIKSLQIEIASDSLFVAILKEVEEKLAFTTKENSNVSIHPDDVVPQILIQYVNEISPSYVDTRGILNFLISSEEASLTIFLSETAYNEELKYILKQLPKHVINLFAYILEDPNCEINQVPLLTPREQEELIKKWNPPTTHFSDTQTVCQLFEVQAKLYPKNIALIFQEQQLTYGELNERANQFAHYLRSQGIKPNTLIGVCLDRSFDLFIILLAILKVGGTYLPLDPTHPENRLSYILKDAAVSLLITHFTLSKNFTKKYYKTFCIEDIWDHLNKHEYSIHDFHSEVTMQDLAYVIYTSGSTGNPKGVEIKHQGLSNLLLSMQKILNVQPSHRWLAMTTVAFDMAVPELYLPLISGASITIATKEIAINPNRLSQLIQAEKINFMQATPITWRMLIDSGWEGSSNLQGLCGGESISESLAHQLQNKLACLWHAYGPTETTVWSTMTLLNPRDRINLGKPIDNTLIYLLDSQLQPVPIGIPGELYIGGAGLARGYLNKPELTQERFISNPFLKFPGERIYKTGDLCRYLPEGTLQYLGRIDHQIKIRGFRVELNEIETVLCRHSKIKEAIVLAKEDNKGEIRLVAYWIAIKEKDTLSFNELRSFLSEYLPDYMLPSALIQLEKFPLTSNGKLDREALPSPTYDRANAPYLLPNTDTERVLAQIWGELLNIDAQKIGVQDNFFALGGDSIRIMQLIIRIEALYKINISIDLFVENPTITALAEIIDSNNACHTTNKIKKVSRGKNEKSIGDPNNRYFPLTPLQRGLLFQNWMDPLGNSYEIQMHCSIEKPLNVTALKLAWKLLVERHAVLRTTFVWEGLDEVMQVIHDQIILPWNFYDWRDLDKEQQKVHLQRFLKKDQEDKTDLNSAPLFRLTLIRTAEARYEFIWRSHHILLDGWSLNILMAELWEFYQADLEKRTLDLPTAAQFSEYVAWLQHQNYSKEKEFWQNFLRNFTTPTDLMIASKTTLRSNFQGEAFKSKSIQLSFTQSRSIRLFAQSLKVSLNTFFQGLWAILLHRYSQSNDIVFGATVSGRHVPLEGIENHVGLFINTIPFRVQFTDELTTETLLIKTQKDFSKVIPYSHTPLPIIQNCSELEGISQSLFESILVFENYPEIHSSKLGDTFKSHLNFWDPTHYPITAIIIPEQQINLKFGYDSRRIPEESIEDLLLHVEQLCQSMINQANKTIHELELLPSFEYQSVTQMQGNIVDTPPKMLVELVEEWAAKTPSEVAVSFIDKSLTYVELNEASNQLAYYLRKNGVKSEVAIGVYLPRCLNIVVSLLAIWKAGGVYVPLNPELPLARIETMIAMSNIKIVLTEKDIYNNYLLNENSTLNAELVFIDTYKAEPQNADRNPPHLNQLNNLAYILYTSGSTGVPKGVLHEHRTLANLIRWQTKNCSYQPGQRISQLASINFDVSLQEIVYALSNGYQLHIVPSKVKQSITALLDFVKEKKVSQAFLPTALLELFCEAALFTQYKFEQLRHLFVAGEALKISSVIKEFFAQNPNVCLTNQYGPTETHVVTAYELPLNTHSWPNLPPIGKPIDNTRLYILDNHLKPLPRGVAGELYVGGMNIARNYIGSSNALSSFIPDPFNQNPGELLYRTGDVVQRRKDGILEYVTRIDQQIKIRGYRVEPQEIECVLLKEPGVDQCVVLAEPDDTNQLQLICYIASKSRKFNEASLQEVLAKALPHYMIPKQFSFVEAIPTTINGKIDKVALAKMKVKVIETKKHRTPQNFFENELLEIWKQILNIKDCGIDEDFFRLGGDSLKVLRLLLAIEKLFNIELNVEDLLLFPTIEKIANKLMDVKGEQLLNRHENIHYKNIELPFPIVPLQKHGNKPPLFLIHPIGGTLFWFVELVRRLGNNRPIYGIQDPSIGYEKILFNSIEEMAEYYLYCIQSIQEHEPYLIAGFSFGATVAFEIARQLEASGKQAEFIGLLDGWASYPTKLNKKSAFQKMMQEENERLYKYFQINQLKNIEQWQDLQWQRNELLWQYSFTRLQSPLTLFKSEKLLTNFNWIDHPYNYWDEYSLLPIKVHSVPGDHETMLKEPNVKVLAKRLSQSIRYFDRWTDKTKRSSQMTAQQAS